MWIRWPVRVIELLRINKKAYPAYYWNPLETVLKNNRNIHI